MDDEANGDGQRDDLVIQGVVAMAVGGASLAGADAGAAATALAPWLAAVLGRLSGVLRVRRHRHAAETLAIAVDAASLPAEEFAARALADDELSELLVRALTAAQDTALREKRRALGRALADGVRGDSDVNDEMLFIRAVADLDAPHIAVLGTISLEAPSNWPLPRMWTYRHLVEALPALGDSLGAILATLELHTLISKMQLNAGSGRAGMDLYRIEPRGTIFLDRLADDTD